MIIKRVKKTNLYDIFLGNGWYNHTRVFFSNGHCQHAKGKHLPKIKYVEASKTIEEMLKVNRG